MGTTIESKVQKLIGLYGRGLVTQAEVVNDFLLTAADVESPEQAIDSLDVLPRTLRHAVTAFLHRLAASDFEWHPLMIGEGLTDSELAKLRGRLRAIYGLLNEAEHSQQEPPRKDRANPKAAM